MLTDAEIGEPGRLDWLGIFNGVARDDNWEMTWLAHKVSGEF
jgi:hypothetical protein